MRLKNVFRASSNSVFFWAVVNLASWVQRLLCSAGGASTKYWYWSWCLLGSLIAVCWALVSLVATDILWICFTSFNRLCGLQHANLASQNHWKHEPLQHFPWPWRALLTHPATLGKLRMNCLAAGCCSVGNWLAMLVFHASQAPSDYVLEWDTCVGGVELKQLVKEDCLQE